MLAALHDEHDLGIDFSQMDEETRKRLKAVIMEHAQGRGEGAHHDEDCLVPHEDDELAKKHFERVKSSPSSKSIGKMKMVVLLTQ